MWSGSLGKHYNFIESGEECLVTDITHELSAGLENPSLLAKSVSLFDHEEDGTYSDYTTNFPGHCNYDFINEYTKTEECDLDDYGMLYKQEQSSGSGSGSETSSLEQNWNIKNEIDTPPTTPPQTSPESVHFITSNKLTYVPAADVKVVTSSRSRCKRLKAIAAKGVHSTCISDLIISSKVLYPAGHVITGEDDASPGPDPQKSKMTREEQQRLQVHRRQERMIRNRESAYLSRKRKKEHVSLLEKQVEDLTLENQKLKQENAALRESLHKYEPWKSTKLSWHRVVDSGKTTAFLAIATTFCIQVSLLGVPSLFSPQQLPVDSGTSSYHSRSLLWLDDSDLTNLTTSCPINQSESMRLERELRRWIVGEKDLWHTAKTVPPQSSVSGRKKRLPRTRMQAIMARRINVFDIKPQLLGMESLYEAIHRRADTFYLVSFSADHLLLPAISSNQTSRPKISVMLPAVLANLSSGGSDVEMMQIDCEVTNTQFLSVRGDDIPSHMRNSPKYSNVSVKAGSADPHTFQAYEISENLLINLHKKTNFPGLKSNSTTSEPYPILSQPADPAQNLSIPELVSPYINVSLESPSKNGSLVTKPIIDVENTTDRAIADFENEYRHARILLESASTVPHNKSITEKVERNPNSYLRLFTRG